MTQRNWKRKERAALSTAVISVCVAAAVLFGCALILTTLVSGEKISESTIGGFARLVLAVTGFAVGACSTLAGQNGYLSTLAIAAAAVYLGLIGMNVFAFGGEIKSIGASTAVYLLGIGVSALMYWLRLKRGRKQPYRHNFR